MEKEEKLFFYDTPPPVIDKIIVHDDQMTLSGLESVFTPQENRAGVSDGKAKPGEGGSSPAPSESQR